MDAFSFRSVPGPLVLRGMFTALCVFLLSFPDSAVAESLQLGTRQAACEALRSAHLRYTAPHPSVFYQTQAAFRAAYEKADRGLAVLPEEQQQLWKKRLRFDLMDKNSQRGATVQVADLQTVQRWLFSNLKGIETPFFASLRATIRPYADAAETFSIEDLKGRYVQYVTQAYNVCMRLAAQPNAEDALRLGPLLGWLKARGFEKPAVERIGATLSFGNASVAIGGDFIQRLYRRQGVGPTQKTTPVEQTLNVPIGFLGANKSVRAVGSATTHGQVSLSLVPNATQAELRLTYLGHTHSTARSQQGKIVSHSQIAGPVQASRSLFFTEQGLIPGPVQALSDVRSTPTSVEAPGRFIARIAWRKMHQQNVQAAIQQQSNQTVRKQLAAQFLQEMQTALDQSENKLSGLQNASEGFAEVLAPIEREGAEPHFHSSFSTASALHLEAEQRAPMQFGAPSRCDSQMAHKMGKPTDILGCVHQSFLSNSMETAWGGKWVGDGYFMEMAKILQAELPLVLMVHSRTPRWSLKFRKLQPVQWRFLAEKNQVSLTGVLSAVEIDGEKYFGETRFAANYALKKDAYGAFLLERLTPLTTHWSKDHEASKEQRALIESKLGAIVAKKLDAKGVSLPDGGFTGILSQIQPEFVLSQNEWLYLGLDIPDSTLDEVQALQQ